MALIGNTNEEKIWNYLLSQGLNKFGAAGLMGNLFAESGLKPNNLENLCEQRLKENGKPYVTDELYTAAVDNGTISKAEFLNPLPNKQYGYGLAQWTSPGRKSGLYDLVKSRKVSISDLETQLDWLIMELQNSYKSVYNVLKTASSIKEASDAVLLKFECPADTSDSMKNNRASYGQKYYNTYASKTINTPQTTSKLKGIDVSYHNGEIDWNKVKNAGIQFAVLREGYRKVIDTQFLTYAKGCIANNIPIMVYHFIYTNGATIKENAESTVKNMKLAGLDITKTWIWADLEYDTWTKNGETCTKAKCSQYTQQYIDELKKLGCKNIGIYLNNDYYANYYTQELLSNYPLWLADYSGDADHSCVMQQYSSNGIVNGINSGGVDVNYLFDKTMIEINNITTPIQQEVNTIMGKYDNYINSTGTHYISNSGSDENGSYANGAAGDQTGNEWNIRSWYNRPWDCVLRYEKDSNVGMKLAELGCAAALNNKIGYDQYQRDTYWNQLKANGYDPSKITVACESDCSAGVIANTKAVGYILGIPALQQLTATYTGNMKNAYRNAGFTVLTDSKYTTGASYLLPGDILLNEVHHTATNVTKGSQATATITPTKENTSYVGKGIGTATSKVEMNIRTTSSTSGAIVGVIPSGTKVEVLAIESNKWYKIVWPGCEVGYAYTSNSTGTYYSYTANKVESTPAPAPTPAPTPASKVTATNGATSFNKSIAGTYKVTADSLNVRHGAGTNNKIMVAIPEGTKVTNYGYYSSSNGTKWYYVQFTYKNVLYTGFCSSNYLKKV